MKKTYYITTPLYYSSGALHLGHCYTTVICDALARFKRMQGLDVFYLTGTDEHGQKVEEMAKAAGKSPKEYVDGLYNDCVELWKTLNISYDKFIRTTDDYHEKAVQKIFAKLNENGDLYKSEYEGLYCTPCEAFWTESQLVDGCCPDCHRPVHSEKEESYFFKLSNYADRLLELFESNESFIQPVSRKNEMINNFIKPGLKDLCVSRTNFSWGVPVDFDKKHVVYVWVDALSNYITALGYGTDDTSLFEKYWPADLHMVGKEITRFHTIIWPALLMALDLPMPKQVYGHGWLNFYGDKMSKSKGNVAFPLPLIDRVGVDAVRYYLLREVPFGSDGSFTNEGFLTRINTDLCNSLGNLVSRTTAMTLQNFESLPSPNEFLDVDKGLIEFAESTLKRVEKHMDELNAPDALHEIFKLVDASNKYIEDTTPWVLAKTDKERLATVLYTLLESIRFVGVLLLPFLPNTAERVLNKVGVDEIPSDFASISKFGGLKGGETITKGENLFDRIDIAKVLKEMEEEK